MDFNRKVMVFSVSVLGLSLATFLLAYMVYGDNTDEDLRTLRQTNVRLSPVQIILIIDFAKILHLFELYIINTN